MTDFVKFRTVIQKQFDRMAKNGNLFVSSVTKDEIWDTYLSSFPEGTNPMFRERTEHDCQCCKQFIRKVGRVMGKDSTGNLVSIWDIKVDNYYQEVADQLSNLNHNSKISGIFVHNEPEIGKLESYEELEDGTVHTWQHFHLVIPVGVYIRGSLGEAKGAAQTNCKVLKRSLEELSPEAIETVSDLITGNAIYRGQEHKSTVDLLQRVQREYKEANDKDLYLWDKAVELKGVCAFRNTVIGSLIVDLSEGTDLEVAVKKFEDKVAPHNYKRSKALVTPRMKEDAKKKAKELGIEPSLVRRHATKEDISVNDVLFADSSVKPFMEDSVFDVVKPTKTGVSKAMDKVQEVSVSKFLKDILPKADSIEVLLENKHEKNLMSLIAPVNGCAPCIMKWGNNFSWSYNGDVADSMKDRVKAAGGKVDGDLRFSIQWNDNSDNENDLDAHCIEPDGNVIYYSNKVSRNTLGNLDIDIMNPYGKVAVENITYPSRSRMHEGVYTFQIHNFSERGGRNWSAEVEFEGNIFSFSHEGGMKNNEKITVAKVEYTKKGGFKLLSSLPSNQSSKEVWGLDTKDFHKVDMVMNSPNHWDNSQKTGNEHLFFVLQGCKNPDDVRGFYNEYLIQDLVPHRKVFEVLASNLKASYSEDQLSGLGFSSTQKNEVTLRVKGSYNRVIKVVFGI
ncbi:coil containing protein [Vibrio phage 1.170.O._10N.261.52.C3]|nr:coil containing protein [Vibrio phage 1.170.O._10N.261.52.C3]